MKIYLLYLMAAIYLMAGINHFWHPKMYLRIMPPYLPQPQLLNQLAGVAEIVLGILLLFRSTQKFSAFGIAFMLLLFVTVHIYMLQQSLQRDHYIISPTVAWLRLLLQPILIAWALWYTK